MQSWLSRAVQRGCECDENRATAAAAQARAANVAARPCSFLDRLDPLLLQLLKVIAHLLEELGGGFPLRDLADDAQWITRAV